MADAINLCKLIEEFGSEDRCRAYLEALRWHNGVTCPRCNAETTISRIAKRNKYDCDSCRYQFSVTAGTIFNDTHLPLWKWFLATYLICESRKGMSANQLKRTLGISYKTSWYLCHRIRKAMEETERPKLDGTVEIDETYVGGKKKGMGVWYGKHSKEVVIGIRQRDGEIRFFHTRDAKSKTVREVITANVDEHVELVVTDESAIYPFAFNGGVFAQKHETVNHSAKEYVRGHVYTNSVESSFSLLKRGIVGTWHRLSAKHLAAYLDEMEFRFNNRENPFLFRDTLIRLLNTSAMEYKALTAA